MKFRKYVLTGIVLLFLAASYGYTEGPVNGNGSRRMWTELKLTSEQQEKLKALHGEMGVSKSKYATSSAS